MLNCVTNLEYFNLKKQILKIKFQKIQIKSNQLIYPASIKFVKMNLLTVLYDKHLIIIQSAKNIYFTTKFKTKNILIKLEKSKYNN